MIHPDTELRFISHEIGYGVVATKFIPAGTITWAQDKLDRVFSPMEVLELEDMYKTILDIYTFRNNRGEFVLCWDHGRYVNHSFRSNCLSTAYDFEIAVNDIYPGEQITDDYGYLNVTMPFRAIDEGTKRKVVYPDDLLRYHKIWDKKLKDTFGKINRVAQPLASLIPAETWEKVDAIIANRRQMDSILNNYCG